MAKTLATIRQISDPKERLFACMDRIEELKKIPSCFGLSRDEQLELENLESLQMDWYSDWKDPQ